MMNKDEEDCWASLEKPIQVKKSFGSLIALIITLVDQSVSVNEAQDLAGVFIEES